MKRLSVLMSFVLIMALAVAPAFASTEITGKVSVDVRWEPDLDDLGKGKLTAEGVIDTEVVTSIGSDGAIKAVLDVSAFATGDDDIKFGNGFKAIGDKLEIKAAYIETTGSWFKGTAPATTRLGRFGTSINPWIADFGDKDSVRVEGLELGGADMTLYYAWSPAVDADEGRRHLVDGLEWDVPESHIIGAVSADFSIDIVDLTGTYVRTVSDNDLATSTNYALNAALTPADGIGLELDYVVSDREDLPNDGNSAWKFTGTLETLPEIGLKAEVWNTGQNFDPFYPELEGDDDEKEAVKFATDRKGYKLTLDTTQAGIDFELSYEDVDEVESGDHIETVTKLSGSTDIQGTGIKATITNKDIEDNMKFELELTRSFGIVNGLYKLEIDHDSTTTHTVEADWAMDTFIADDVEFFVGVELPEGKDAQLDLDVAWQAPNGISLGLHYANYDDNDDYPEGLQARAGIEVEF